MLFPALLTLLHGNLGKRKNQPRGCHKLPLFTYRLFTPSYLV
jgi:hypothetical protein